LGLVELFRNAIASSIGAMVAKELSVKMVLFMAAEVCLTQGCARRRETFLLVHGPRAVFPKYGSWLVRVHLDRTATTLHLQL
jgi:hypothetical protein